MLGFWRRLNYNYDFTATLIGTVTKEFWSESSSSDVAWGKLKVGLGRGYGEGESFVKIWGRRPRHYLLTRGGQKVLSLTHLNER